jgi:hypothetical protein
MIITSCYNHFFLLNFFLLFFLIKTIFFFKAGRTEKGGLVILASKKWRATLLIKSHFIPMSWFDTKWQGERHDHLQSYRLICHTCLQSTKLEVFVRASA